MNTKLVYLYIKDINRGFHNLDFNFTDEFIVTYNHQTYDLYIEKKEPRSFELWGSKINSINLIVGRNGAGKSSVLELIAETEINRNRIFNKSWGSLGEFHEYKSAEWFAIYHLEENTFIVEGEGPKLLFEKTFKSNANCDYTFICRCNFTDSIELHRRQIQSEGPGFQKETKMDQFENYPFAELVFLYGADLGNVSWLQAAIRDSSSDTYSGFQRVRIPTVSTRSIYYFLTNEYDMLEKEKFTAQNVVCIIDKKDPYRGIHDWGKDIKNKKLLYQGKPLITKDIFLFLENKEEYFSFNNKERFIITLLESYIVNACNNIAKEKVNDLKKSIDSIEFDGFPQEQSFENLLKYLFVVLKVVCNVIFEEYLEDRDEEYRAQALVDFITSLKLLKDEYFISEFKIEIPINSEPDEKVEQVLKLYDLSMKIDLYRYSDLKKVIGIHYSNMSKGEMTFVNHFSSLYEALTTSENNNIRNIIICLDEPEESFHPEWARKYIYYLTTFLNQVKMNDHIKYQVIISTHSPFIVSDVPNNNITCIKLIEKDGVYARITEKANFGFGSNLYDIIKNDFFLDSSIGEFATKEINKVLEEINELSSYNEEEIKKIQSFINIIGDKFIQNKINSILKQRITVIMSDDEKNARIRELEEELSQLKGSRHD
ncbi:AAA family ATPase [Bacillus bombysepticus]|uniref:AAA family ATPase n=1 Tax=Bacillus bombysepticus TaxID=658666 RepID=UPI00207A2DD9|nr:AAA family ATPase [Bacillus bombysepticus]USL10738.1 AAA family ATPase [Bacillus bombysepticus]